MHAGEVQSKCEARLGEESVAFLSCQWLHFVGKSANPAAAFSWPMSWQTPRLHTTEKMSSTRSLVQLLLSFYALLFICAHWNKTNPVCMEMVVVNAYAHSFCFQMCTSVMRWNTGLTAEKCKQFHFGWKAAHKRRKTYLQWKGRQPRCGSAFSVSPGRGKSGPPRRPPELPQHRRPAAPGWQSDSLQSETHAG